MKKLIVLTIGITVFAHSNLRAMEQPKEEVSQEMVALVDLLPLVDDNALLAHVVCQATHCNAPIKFYENKTSCIQFGPRSVIKPKDSLKKKETHKAILSVCDQWVPSINYNSCEIVYANNESTMLTFACQCWHNGGTYFTGLMPEGLFCYTTEYRIDDDLEKKRFMASAYLKIGRQFFEGPNGRGIFLIGANSQNKEEIEEAKEESSELATKKRAKVYQYYLGGFTPNAHHLYEKGIFENIHDNSFDFISPKIIGTLTALALHRTDKFCTRS